MLHFLDFYFATKICYCDNSAQKLKENIVNYQTKKNIANRCINHNKLQFRDKKNPPTRILQLILFIIILFLKFFSIFFSRKKGVGGGYKTRHTDLIKLTSSLK